jgi:hypothetical protein
VFIYSGGRTEDKDSLEVMTGSGYKLKKSKKRIVIKKCISNMLFFMSTDQIHGSAEK